MERIYGSGRVGLRGLGRGWGLGGGGEGGSWEGGSERGRERGRDVFGLDTFPVSTRIFAPFYGPVQSKQNSWQGGIAAAITTPLDVAKTRILLAQVNG